ncbi:unnamed protein product, partial [Urochloa humidicola]
EAYGQKRSWWPADRQVELPGGDSLLRGLLLGSEREIRRRMSPRQGVRSAEEGEGERREELAPDCERAA